jgi:hypothetical protein
MAGVRFPVGTRDFFYSIVFRPTLGPTQWVPGALSPGIKQLGLKADHSLPSSAVVKTGRAIYFYYTIRLYGVVLN